MRWSAHRLGPGSACCSDRLPSCFLLFSPRLAVTPPADAHMCRDSQCLFLTMKFCRGDSCCKFKLGKPENRPRSNCGWRYVFPPPPPEPPLPPPEPPEPPEPEPEESEPPPPPEPDVPDPPEPLEAEDPDPDFEPEELLLDELLVSLGAWPCCAASALDPALGLPP